MNHIGRKLYHLIGGLGLLSVYYILGRERALFFYAVFFIIVLALDAARLIAPAWNQLIFTRFGSFVRENEKRKLSGSPTYILGVGLSLYWYAPQVATAAICFLAIGDVAATTIGERWGKTKIGQKSLEGTAAFVVAALCAGLLLSFAGIHLPAWILVVGALTAACAELLPIPVNDNLVIPLTAGGVMQLALAWAS